MDRGTITRNELITSDEYLLGNIQYELYEDIKQHFEKSGMKPIEYAAKLGVSKGYISQILNGNFDHKISKLISLYKGIGVIITGLQKVELKAYVEADTTKDNVLKLRPMEWVELHREADDFHRHELYINQKIEINKSDYQHGFTGPAAPIPVQA